MPMRGTENVEAQFSSFARPHDPVCFSICQNAFSASFHALLRFQALGFYPEMQKKRFEDAAVASRKHTLVYERRHANMPAI